MNLPKLRSVKLATLYYLCIMLEIKNLRFFRQAILQWYKLNKRDFPWRVDGVSNYELILSEILLQRTRAETVARYYSTFFSKYPDWESLSSANTSDLEGLLEPLGLHRHRASRIQKITRGYKEKNGILPLNSNELRESTLSSLYISGAYEIFVLKQRAALIDVNMSRVLKRVFSPGEKKDVRNDTELHTLAKRVTDTPDCKELNWAILDYAAMVCKSSKPGCDECVLKTKCKYFAGLNT